MLTLPIKSKWWVMIVTKVKPEEYRDKSPYYISRLGKYADGSPFKVRLRAGYRKTSPLVECTVTLHEGPGREEWGAAPGWEGYIIKIQNVEVKIWN